MAAVSLAAASLTYSPGRLWRKSMGFDPRQRRADARFHIGQTPPLTAQPASREDSLDADPLGSGPPPSPDELLANCRNAVAAANWPMLAVCYATLDRAMSQGYPLPAKWAANRTATASTTPGAGMGLDIPGWNTGAGL
jgi:hypothetical protein